MSMSFKHSIITLQHVEIGACSSGSGVLASEGADNACRLTVTSETKVGVKA